MSTKSFRKVALDAMIYEDNVRDPACLALDQMVTLIRTNGWLDQHVPVVHEVSPGEGEEGGIYKVLQGNRRTLALRHIREHHSEEFVKILPSGKVTCQVYKGLTPQEEVSVRVDHSPAEDRFPLDPWGQFTAIKQLVQAEFGTQDQIAAKLGLFYPKGKSKGQPNRNFVQVRSNLARLPLFVQEEMHRYCLDPYSTALRWQHIAGLYKVYGKEFDTYPNGDGPEFQAKWREVTTPVSVEEKRGKALTPKGATDRAQAATSVILKRILLACVSMGSDTLAALDNALVSLEKDSQTLAAIRFSMGDADFARLIEEITQTSVGQPVTA